MRVSGRSRTVANYVMAEKEGFEPSIRDKPYTPLAGERLQPLGHFSNFNFVFFCKKDFHKFERWREYMDIAFR